MACPCRCTPTEKLLGNCSLDVASRSGLDELLDEARKKDMLRLGLDESEATAEATYVRIAGRKLWVVQDKQEFLRLVRHPQFQVQGKA